MELKEFIKQVLSDVTGAVKECQEDLKNGSVVNPGRKDQIGGWPAVTCEVKQVEFDVALSTSAEGEGRAFISVLGGRIARGSTEVSRVRFSIPVLLPPSADNDAQRGETAPRASYLDTTGTVSQT